MPPPLRAAGKHGIAYRPMADEDLPFVADLYASTRAEEVAQTGWPAAQQQAFLDQQHRAQHLHYRNVFPDAEWLIVERGGERIGRLYLAESGDRVMLIDISLVPAARGAGLGGAILADLMHAAGAAGKRVSLHVERLNPARRLYVRHGFTLVSDKGIYLEMEWRPDGADGAAGAAGNQKKIAS